MVKLQGTAPNQVPTNADLGSLAYVDHDNVNLTAADLKLKALSKTKSQTAVDVFVYDTSKDSDGGAWRKRTQHTSWYNEGASSTRGSRKEFPAVAVIVAESNKVTIYDGDDPSLPMWMVFNRGVIGILAHNGISVTSAAMVNGILSVGTDPTGLRVIEYISDTAQSYHSVTAATYQGPFLGSISQRNDAVSFNTPHPAVIVNATVNDVAMTVLPDAPTDPATGLPVPTIAVATDGGVSVIRDDGTVVDITCADNGFTISTLVDFRGSQLWMNQGNSGSVDSFFVFDAPPTADTALTLNSKSGTGADADAYYKEHPTLGDLHFVGDSSTDLNNAVSQGSVGSNDGLNHIAEDATTPANGMVAYTTSDYTTGWMPGDIKLAALADTTAETVGDAVSGATVSDPNGDGVYDGNHVVNGTFDTDTTGWAAFNYQGHSVTISSVSGEMTVENDPTNGGNAAAYQAIPTVIGQVYSVSVDFISTTTGTPNVLIRNSVGGATLSSITTSGAGVYTTTFTATATSTFIIISQNAIAAGNTTKWDNISVRLADADRSVNGKGLAVHGSITKAAVATGADVVAYSGFSGSNYLEQPYNADLDFGTGDFCVMGWVKGSSQSSFDRLFERSDGTNISMQLTQNGSNNVLLWRVSGVSITTPSAMPLDTWFHFCAVRRSGTGAVYIDGSSVVTGSQSGSVTLASATTMLGNAPTDLTRFFNGSLALWRISATAPTADQIAKIYNDEKFLFQDNAKATLTGSSDAVTALAHDPATDLLHVGTSSGRSVFQGLRRVDETATAVTTAISAVDGLVVEQ